VTRPNKAHVIIAAPEWVQVGDMDAVKDALREKGAIVSPFRDDIFFHPDEFESSCRKGTHFALMLDDKEFSKERRLVSVVALSKVGHIGMICLGSCEALRRHKNLFKQRRVNLVVRRSYLDNSELCSGVSHHIVAVKIPKSARQIAEAILLGWQ